jgi:uncharacterized protein (DUF1697 family)
MKTYIALFRGINVGGNNLLPMKELTAQLEKHGAQGVQTYIQSGNAVFRHEAGNAVQLSNRISAAIRESHGFEPRVILLDVAEIERAIAANPYPAAEAKTLHFYFLADEPSAPDLLRLDGLKQNDEQFTLIHKVFYLYAPAGIGRSKLAVQVEKALGVAATARNWRTVGKIGAMAQHVSATE